MRHDRVLAAQLEGLSGGDRGGGVEQVVWDGVIFTTEARRRGERPRIMAPNEREGANARVVAADLRRKAQISLEQLAISQSKTGDSTAENTKGAMPGKNL